LVRPAQNLARYLYKRNCAVSYQRGVDIAVNKRLAIRALQADFMYIRAGNGFDAGIYQGRLSSGLVVRF
jgi:hypothetical protein